MAALLFDSIAEALEQATSLDRLESRGTLRLALKTGGLDARSLTAEQLALMRESALAYTPANVLMLCPTDRVPPLDARREKFPIVSSSAEVRNQLRSPSSRGTASQGTRDRQRNDVSGLARASQSVNIGRAHSSAPLQGGAGCGRRSIRGSMR